MRKTHSNSIFNTDGFAVAAAAESSEDVYQSLFELVDPRIDYESLDGEDG